MDLSLNQLRLANTARLPEFKNKHGELSHSKPDGSDWTPAQWLEAMVGEVGEFAEARLKYEVDGLPEYELNAAKELADIQTYLDILARRSLDTVPQLNSPEEADSAQRLMVVMSNLGQYANLRKKLNRGDCSQEDFNDTAPVMLNAAIQAITQLMVVGPHNAVCEAHPAGVSLAAATVSKFNEVSRRVGSFVRLQSPETAPDEARAFHYVPPGTAVRFGRRDVDTGVVKSVLESEADPRYIISVADGDGGTFEREVQDFAVSLLADERQAA